MNTISAWRIYFTNNAQGGGHSYAEKCGAETQGRSYTNGRDGGAFGHRCAFGLPFHFW